MPGPAIPGATGIILNPATPAAMGISLASCLSLPAPRHGGTGRGHGGITPWPKLVAPTALVAPTGPVAPAGLVWAQTMEVCAEVSRCIRSRPSSLCQHYTIIS